MFRTIHRDAFEALAATKRAKVRAALSDLREVPFHFAARGTQITLLERGVEQP